MNIPDLLQWGGCIAGLAGALTLGLKGSRAGLGFLLYLLSNLLWIGYAVLANATALMTMQIGFTATSAIGVYVWLIKPLLGSRALSAPRRSLCVYRTAPPLGSFARPWAIRIQGR